ncbi:head-to-tail connector protein [Gordonia phage Ghobes]|uniref:Head-to-tail connector protein n=1 Tax=Gordonia phage Ghobes TaxID=1887647 RepID=A0A1B3B092_9CAUD|nr:head-tail adaptor [Gordonia phage Ghobes]AOE44411.1 head-to-tail connector protein [Gordonia phage Ghobes]
MTSPEPLLSAAELVEFTGGRLNAATPGLQRRLDAALGALRAHCGWLPFPVREEALTLSTYGQRPLLLPTLKLLELQELTVLGKVVPVENVEWDENGVLYRPSPDYQYGLPVQRYPWPDRLRSVTVKFRHGFEPEEVAELVGSVFDVASRSVVNPFGRTGYKVGERQENFAVGAGGRVTGARPLGDDLALWDAYALGTRTTEGG